MLPIATPKSSSQFPDALFDPTPSRSAKRKALSAPSTGQAAVEPVEAQLPMEGIRQSGLLRSLLVDTTARSTDSLCDLQEENAEGASDLMGNLLYALSIPVENEDEGPALSQARLQLVRQISDTLSHLDSPGLNPGVDLVTILDKLVESCFGERLLQHLSLTLAQRALSSVHLWV